MYAPYDVIRAATSLGTIGSWTKPEKLIEATR
jgi:hypothetical protein